MGRSRGVRGERTEHTQLFSRTFAGFGITCGQKVNFSTFSGKLELQCTRNGPQNPPFCPGSIKDTFIIFPRYLTNIFSKICCNKSTLNWALVSELGFLDFQIFDYPLFCCDILLKNMLVGYRGINNKGALERPWTK